MMHSSWALETPPLLSTPDGFNQGRMSPRPVEVSMTPFRFRSTHWWFSRRPILTTDPLPPSYSSRLATHTLPLRSTVVLEGLRPRPFGAERYSPKTAPVSVLILTTVPLPEAATQMKGKRVVTLFS